MKGLLLGDRYRILQALGTGGMGRTYVAEDTQRPGRPKCVVKHLRPASTDVYFLATARRLFSAEAEILEQLGQHDRIPRLLAYFEQGEEFYLVQELIEGHPLTAELVGGQRWTEPQVIQLLQEVLEVLEVVHSYSVIHRDVKPDNLLRRKDGKLVLIDFGAVKQVRMQPTAYGSPSVVVGTPGYMPPEQANGRPHRSSDLYALGIIAIQALTGVSPTQLARDAQGEIIWRNLVEVTPGLAFFISKLVRRQVIDRFQTAREAVQALQPIRSEIAEYAPALAFAPPRSLSLDGGSLATHAVNDAFNPVSSASVGVMSTAVSEPTIAVSSAQSYLQPDAQPDAQPDLPPDPQPTRPRPRSRQWGKWFLIGGTIAGVAAGAFAVLSTQWQSEQIQQDTLATITTLRDQQQVSECIEAAMAVPANSPIYGEARALMYQCQAAQYQTDLVEAKQLAEVGQFQAALIKAVSIPATSSAHAEAQELVRQWSERILTIASEYYEAGNLDPALAAIKEIPVDSSIYAQAQETAGEWRDEWQTNQRLYEQARQAFDAKNWQAAIDAVKQIKLFGRPVPTDSAYWRQNIEPVVSRAEAEIAREAAEKRAQELEAAQQQPQPSPSQQTQSWRGRLDRRSSEVRVLPDGKLYRDFAFTGKQNEVVTITMQSSEFNTRLNLIDPQGRVIATNNDDTPFDLNAAITRVTLSTDGTYRIRATSEGALQQGVFTVTLRRNQ